MCHRPHSRLWRLSRSNFNSDGNGTFFPDPHFLCARMDRSMKGRWSFRMTQGRDPGEGILLYDDAVQAKATAGRRRRADDGVLRRTECAAFELCPPRICFPSPELSCPALHCVTDALSCRPRALFPRLSTDALRRTRCHQCRSLSSFFPQPRLPPGKETPRARAAARSTMPAQIVTACRLLFLVRRRPNLSNATLFLTAPTVAPGTQTWSHSAKEQARSLRFVSNRGATSTQYSATNRESP